jgi:hypothetical protein
MPESEVTSEQESSAKESRVRENALKGMNAICLVRDEKFHSPRIAGIARRTQRMNVAWYRRTVNGTVNVLLVTPVTSPVNTFCCGV